MKKISKLLAFVLILVMATMTFTGCTSEEPMEKEVSTTKADTEIEADTEQKETVAEVKELDYPKGQISWIVPAPAGAFIDLPSRIVNDNLNVGKGAIIENIPGASQTIGTEEASLRKADGYTIVTGANGAMVTQPILNPDLMYSPDDFVPLGLLSSGMQQMICVRSDSDVKTVEEWMALVQSDARITWTASNPGSVGHITASETLDQLESPNSVFVPYTGTAEVVQALLGGDVDFAVLEARNGKSRSDAGEVTMIALLNGPMYQYAPEVPMVSEFGIEGIDRFAAWVYVAIHKDTPADIVEYLRAEFKTAIYSDEYQQWLDDNMFGRLDHEYTMEEIDTWRKEAGIANKEVLKKLGMID